MLVGFFVLASVRRWPQACFSDQENTVLHKAFSLCIILVFHFHGILMLIRNLFAAAFLLFAGLFNGQMDSLQFHFGATIFSNKAKFDQQFWNPAESWKNKYKNHDPKQGEAFVLSSTALVFVTDGWHLFKFLMLKCFLLAVVLFLPFSAALGYERWQVWLFNAGSIVILHICFQIGFKLSYV